MLEFSHPLCSSADRRVRKLGRISKQSLHIADGTHAGKDDPDVGAGGHGVRLGYTCGGTGKTVAWILVVGLEGAGKIAILFELKLGEMVTTIATFGSNVVTVEYKDFSFTLWAVGGQGRSPSTTSLPPGYEWSDLCCRQ